MTAVEIPDVAAVSAALDIAGLVLIEREESTRFTATERDTAQQARIVLYQHQTRLRQVAARHLPDEVRQSLLVAHAVITVHGHGDYVVRSLLAGCRPTVDLVQRAAQVCRQRDTAACRTSAKVLDRWAGELAAEAVAS